jgi:uncharacterized protein
VEVAQRFVEHWNDTGDVAWQLCDPDFTWVIDPPAWLAGTYRGRAEVEDLLGRTWEVYDEFRYEIDEFIDAGDSVVGLGPAHVRGAQSGATVVQTGAVVHRLRDGRIVALRIYLNRDEALEAVGLRE